MTLNCFRRASEFQAHNAGWCISLSKLFQLLILAGCPAFAMIGRSFGHDWLHVKV